MTKRLSSPVRAVSPDGFFQRMLRNFLPSRTLSHYMVRLHMGRFMGILIGLTAVLQMLDLLAQSDTILSADGATYASTLAYITLRAPQLISQFTPFAALLATLLTLATLSQSSEITAMKAMGLSAHRILLPLGLVSFLIVVAHFAFNEYIVTKANADLDWWQKNDYALDLPERTNTIGNIWLTDKDQLINVKNVSKLGSGLVLDQVSIFERAGTGRLKSLAKADFAVHQNGRWTLHNVRAFDPVTHQLETTATKPWSLDVGPDRFSLFKIRPAYRRTADLWQDINRLKAEGLPTDRLMTSLLQKFAGPASTILMPLLGAVAAFGLSRRGNLLLRIIGGMALGFSFFVADNFMLAMGEFGVVPPLLAAWAPFFLFLMIGYAIIFTTEEGRRPLKPLKFGLFPNVQKS